jgi:UDP:flavonoid glycosyltransferase YjiC (YdhE family)
MLGDQFYWSSRVRSLGIGSVGSLASGALTSSLRGVLVPEVLQRSASLAKQLPSDGAMVAAKRLVGL